MSDQHDSLREGGHQAERLRWLGLAALSLAAGLAAGRAALAMDARPEHLAAALATGFAGLAGVGKRAAP